MCDRSSIHHCHAAADLLVARFHSTKQTLYEPFALFGSHQQVLGSLYVSEERQQPRHSRGSHWRRDWRGRLEQLLYELQQLAEFWFWQARSLPCQHMIAWITKPAMLRIEGSHTGFECALRRENMLPMGWRWSEKPKEAVLGR